MSTQLARHNGTVTPSARGPALVAVPFLKGRGSEPVELLTDEQRQQLLECATIREFPARTIVYAPAALQSACSLSARAS